jgi:hypothetical protein
MNWLSWVLTLQLTLVAANGSQLLISSRRCWLRRRSINSMCAGIKMDKEVARLRRVLVKIIHHNAPKHIPGDRRHYSENAAIREFAMAALCSTNYMKDIDLDLDARDSELRSKLPAKVRRQLERQ